MPSNSDLQAKHGWNPIWARKVLRLKPDVELNSPDFTQAVRVYQQVARLKSDGLLGHDTYGVMRIRACEPTVEDIEWLGALIRHEAGSESKTNNTEAAAVGWTVANRILLAPERFGASVKAVITKPRQYTGPDKPGVPDGRARTVARALLCGELPCPVLGAVYYYSPRSMPKRDAPEWPGEAEAKHRRYYREGEKYFLWDRDRGKRYHSTRGGWQKINGKEVAMPGFAVTCELVKHADIRDWWFRFYRER